MDTWRAPAKGWPSFGTDGKILKESGIPIDSGPVDELVDPDDA